MICPRRWQLKLGAPTLPPLVGLLPDERKESATRFLHDALAWFRAHGVRVQRVMTDNGSAYKSRLFAHALDAHGISHKRTRPYTPRTNGKAERFIQTSIREWAYAKPFSSCAERSRATHHLAERLQHHNATLSTQRKAARQPYRQAQPPWQ